MPTTKSGRVDQETWDKLVAAYREDPGNYSHAARACLVQRKTARRAYEVGYPDRPWGAKSIRQLLFEEQELARSRLQLVEDQAQLEDDRLVLEAERNREAARQHALRAKEQEATLVAGSRAAAMRGLAAVMEAAPGIKAACVRLTAELEKLSLHDGDLSPKQLGAVSSITRRFSSTLRELVQAGQMAMEMERLYLGQPTEIVGVQTALDELPISDLVRMAGYQDEVLQRAAARGVVRLPPATNGAVKSGSNGAN
jgi:hypothetical protein